MKKVMIFLKNTLGEWTRRIGYLFTRNRRRRELADEMAFHCEMADRSGVPDKRRSFGNSLRLQEQAREAWGWTWIDRLFQDLRYAARTLFRSPGFTITAILILAIGIGVNVTAFSLFNMAVLQSLPVRDPGTLLRLQRRSMDGQIAGGMPYPTAIYFRDHAHTLSGILTTADGKLELENDLEPRDASFVSSNFLDDLGASAAYGRLFSPRLDDAPNAHLVAVLGYHFWQTRFSADPNIIGRTVLLNKQAVTVVGITSELFPGLKGGFTDIWIPITQQPQLVQGSKMLTDKDGGAVGVWGRLAPGATAKSAAAELLGLTGQRRLLDPDHVWKGEYIHTDPGARIVTPQPRMLQVGAIFGTLTLLILAVACANLGGLLLARGVTREHELNIRLAIGASRLRIFRQLFTESLLLAVLGSAAGVGLSCLAFRIMTVLADTPKWMPYLPDWRVLCLAAALAFLSSVFFGFAPALQLASQKHRRTLARQLLVGAQVAASCVLLILSSLLVRAVLHGIYSSPGFGYEQVVSVSPRLNDHDYKAPAAEAYMHRLAARLRGLPQVTSVALVKLPPLGGGVTRMDTKVDGRLLQVYPNWVSPEFFATMDIPILLGRNFDPGEKKVVIVSQAMASKQWPGENPLGKIYWDKDVVIGVAGNAHINAMNDGDAVEIYAPAQNGDMTSMSVVFRTQGAPDGLELTCKSIVQNLDPKLFPQISLLKTNFREAMRSVEILVSILTGVGVLAVMLAAVGIVGLVAFTVSQRSKEIAIRFALGSSARQALSAILGQYCWPVLIGLVVGLALTAAFSNLMRFMLYGVSNLDPMSYAAAIALLVGILVAAALLPARRALKLDIARTLHEE
jgi:predicted permease